jgi:hypothetical protein
MKYKFRIIAVIVCFLILILHAFISVSIGWKHGGGVFVYAILFVLFSFIWRTAKTWDEKPQKKNEDDKALPENKVSDYEKVKDVFSPSSIETVSQVKERSIAIDSNPISVMGAKVDDSDFEKWKNGLMVYSKDYECLVSLDNKEYQEWVKKSDEEKEEDWIQYDYLTYDQFFSDWDAIEHERFTDSYQTSDGKKVIAFGYYGHC